MLLQDELPQELHQHIGKLDAGDIGKLMAETARSMPDRYGEILKKIGDMGRLASFRQGETLGLEDMRPVLDRGAYYKQMDAELKEAKRQSASPADFENLRNNIWMRYSDQIEKDTGKAAMAQGNNLAYSVVSGARGKPAQLKAMISTPGLYQDAAGDLVPLFIRNSFGEGLRPAEYLAGSYGARLSVISTKRATAKGGAFSKMLGQAAAPVVVTTKDCGARNGIDLDVDDKSVGGRVLARAIGNYPAGTMIDRHVLSSLRKSKVDKIIVRSAMTCQAKEGVCARCLGTQADGKFPRIGDAVGLTAAQAIGEPITQGALNTKHTGGAASGKREYSGFDVINRFAQSPETFEDRATVAENDGKVDRIEEAPQGGNYVVVDDKPHYVPPGYPVLVKPGQQVEAGDQLAEGLVDAGDIVRLRGVGEGRNYYAKRLTQILDDSGMKADPRNTEILARAAINHVVIGDEDEPDSTLPGDLVSYDTMARNYNPPPETESKAPHEAVGRILQAPALHYSVGTKITPRIAQHLNDAQFGPVDVADKGPSFKAEMVRLSGAAHNNPDWMAAQHTSHLKKLLSDKAVRGQTTDTQSNVHFVPRISVGEGFGEHVRETGHF